MYSSLLATYGVVLLMGSSMEFSPEMAIGGQELLGT